MDNTRSYSPISVGTMISHYRILEKIGAGGMGEVYLAEDGKLGRKVALKFLPEHLTADEEVKSRFTREARTAANLNHPNIVSIHEVGEHSGRPYFVMELVEGESLNMIARGRQLPFDLIIDYAMQICSGLDEAHRAGVIHRDIKPSNIMVDRKGRIRLLDFGLAVAAGDDKLTLTGTTLGTLSYMSPEQLQGKNLGPQSDIFAIGIVLYELTCGIHPFAESTSAEAAARILRDEPADVHSRRPDVPYDLVRIIGRCLKKDPSRRFQTVKDVYNELLDLLEKKEEESFDPRQGEFQDRPKGLHVRKFLLTADLVRKLEIKSPKMIGDRMIYFDNDAESEVLVIYLHAWGVEHRQTREFLTSLSSKVIAPSLYGFDRQSPNRLPLTLEDHCVLLRAFFSDINDRIRPRHVVLIGFSAGADIALHLLTSGLDTGIPVTALLSFGCNISLASCFISSKFAELESGNPEKLLNTIKMIGSGTKTMDEWLKFHEYMVHLFSRFGNTTDPLRSLGKGIVDPFIKNDWRQFADWYRKVMTKVPYVRFVIDKDDFDNIDEILDRHIQSNVLGNDFQEDSIVREDVSHMELSAVEILSKHTNDMIERILA